MKRRRLAKDERLTIRLIFHEIIGNEDIMKAVTRCIQGHPKLDLTIQSWKKQFNSGLQSQQLS
ncbi:MAG: hypothetical protein WBL67_22350 [Nitrososphaeraceae archaeon]